MAIATGIAFYINDIAKSDAFLSVLNLIMVFWFSEFANKFIIPSGYFERRRNKWIKNLRKWIKFLWYSSNFCQYFWPLRKNLLKLKSLHMLKGENYFWEKSLQVEKRKLFEVKYIWNQFNWKKLQNDILISIFVDARFSLIGTTNL